MRQPESTPEKKPRSRWRQRNPDNHRKERNKRRRNAGRPYETTDGNVVPPRSIGNGCKCKKNCRSRLSGNELQLFHAFWDLGSYDKQQVYLSSRIHVVTKNSKTLYEFVSIFPFSRSKLSAIIPRTT